MTGSVKKPRASKVAKVIGITPVPVEAAHAKLSASGSKKWILCTPSARLESQFPDEKSAFAATGTFAHSIFEHRVNVYLGRETELPFEDKIPGHKEHWSQGLSDAVDRAVERAIERIEHARIVCKDPVILLEQRLDYSPWVQDGWGTGDMVIITDEYCEVLDYKNGAGVQVDALENSQFRLYMLGALHTYGHLYDFVQVIGTVLQPYLNNWSSEQLTVFELLEWADKVVVPAAKLAWAGEGEFVAGEHCSSGFCRARFTCAARAESNLAIARSEFALAAPELLTDEQIAQVLMVADDAARWMKDVQAYALSQAVSHGKQYPGFKTVAGRSVRRYSNADAVAQALVSGGVPEEIIYERSLLGITEMERTLGKKRFAELAGDLIERSEPKPVLVPETDKREALSSTSSAVSDFSEVA